MRRLVLVVAGAGLLLAGLPALASSEPAAGSAASEREALTVLGQAVRAGRALAYSGTQYVATWSGDDSATTLADVTHDPGRAPVLSAGPDDGPGPLTATAALDPRHVELLAASYDLRVAGAGRCTGRTATVVEARRDGQVAGRFWVDRASGLLLRREVYDDGRRVRSSAFVDVDVRAAGRAPEPSLAVAPVAVTAEGLRRDGWRVPDELPGGMRLFDTRLSMPEPGEHVLHLAYSDGLSTVSLFAQDGRLGTEPMDGFEAEEVGDRPVWVRHDAPERVVWSGGGRVWTLVSDAPSGTVRAAVAALPRDEAPEDGLLARLGRGLARLGSLLNPFD